MTDRILLRADVEGYTYRLLVEFRPGSVQLLEPSQASRRFVHTTGALVGLAYVFVLGYAFAAFVPAVSSLSGGGVAALVFGVAIIVAFILGLLAIELWWENRALPLLAENPSRRMEVKPVKTTSYKSFQEVRAASPAGELRITIEGSARRVEDALRFASLEVAASA